MMMMMMMMQGAGMQRDATLLTSSVWWRVVPCTDRRRGMGIQLPTRLVRTRVELCRGRGVEKLEGEMAHEEGGARRQDGLGPVNERHRLEDGVQRGQDQRRHGVHLWGKRGKEAGGGGA